MYKCFGFVNESKTMKCVIRWQKEPPIGGINGQLGQ